MEYEVRITREIRFHNSFTVEASNEAEAKEKALAEADESDDLDWIWETMIDESVQSVKKL